ncbi:hypothetical protein K440DRAFT_660136 [Wilcoxina mikolae CBS 423.85]|nr:hypothetical protein K440DRAFT_660136 [Wilcoxina mikolae CBS 423.85]
MPAATQIPADSAALRAAVLSFGKKLPPPSSLGAKTRAQPGTVSTLEPLSPTARQSATRNIAGIPPSPKTPTHSRSSSGMAASIVFTRSSPSKGQDTVGEEGPSVQLRRKLFQDAKDGESQLSTEFPPPLHPMTPVRNRSTSPEKGRVDSSSIEDISSLKNMFERSSTPSKSQSPAIHSPKTNNPSLTAAILATQLLPPASSPGSRRVSPNRGDPPSPTRRSPVHRKVQSESPPKLYPPLPVRRKPSAISSKSSRESLVSGISSTDMRSSALTAATIAHASSARASPTRSPQTTGPQISKAPQPPPPRKTKPVPTDRPSISRKSSLTSLVPTRTGDSTIAASLAPSRTHTPGPRKPPIVPPPPSRRRRSLPVLPKATLKETLRPPPKKQRPPSPKPPRGRVPLPRRSSHHAEALKHKWRWHITPKERRRYEGLWAANKGILLPPQEKDDVVNVVVRDIWRRSRLDFRTLAEIWELVDRGAKGRLSREEFLVGTWLVDMALRGGKVPVKVEDSVWEGVRSIGVIVLPQKGKGKR